MGISPWSQGDGKPTWPLGLQPDSGTFDISGLSTSDFTMVFINSAGQEIIGTGTFSNLTAASSISPAAITYQAGVSDVATLGTYDMRVVVKKGTTSQQTFKFESFVVER